MGLYNTLKSSVSCGDSNNNGYIEIVDAIIVNKHDFLEPIDTEEGETIRPCIVRVTYRGIGLLTNKLFGTTSKTNEKRRLSTKDNKNNVSHRKTGSLEEDEVNTLPRRTQQVSDTTSA